MEFGLNPWMGLILGLFLVFLNGFFVAAEFALVKVRPTQLEPHVVKGNRGAKAARHMVTHLDAYLSATQLGITLASLALGWIGEPAFAWLIEPLVMKIPGASPALLHTISLTTAFLVITILHIVLGELTPKSIAIRKPEPTSLWIAMPLIAFYRITYPAIWILNHSANAILKMVGIEPVTEEEAAADEEELRLILASTQPDAISDQKRDILDNVFELSHRTARQIMVPRPDVVYMSTSKTLEENLEVARASGHTRFPLVEEGDVDHTIGLIHIKDVFRSDPQPESLQPLMREIVFVPDTMRLDRLLRRMRSERSHMAAVLDEFGGVSGLVTMEDVLEEIVGEIQDEFDLEPPEIVKTDESTYELSGQMLVKDLEDELEIEFSSRDEDTVGGVMLSELGRRPRPGDSIELPPLSLEVLEIDGNRAKTIKAKLASKKPKLRPGA